MIKKVKVAGKSYEEGSEEHMMALIEDIRDGLEQAQKIVAAQDDDNRKLMALALTYESAFLMIQEIANGTGGVANIRKICAGALSLRANAAGPAGKSH